MELHLRSTEKIVTLVLKGGEVQARIWQGKTASGIPVHAYITRVAIEADRPAHEIAEFEQSLQETEPMRPEVKALDLRYFVD